MSVSDLQLRRSDRRRADQRRRRNRALVGLGVLVVLGVLGWLVALSPVFALKQVQVSGTSLLTTDQVLQTAAAPMGTPLVRVSEQAIADRLAAMPQIASVHVTKKWPNDLRIEVTERVPAFTVSRDGRWLLVDRQGVGFMSVAERPDKLVEVRPSSSAPDQLAGAAAITLALGPELTGSTDHLEVAGRDSIKLVTSDNRQVFFGSGEQAELKVQVASALLRNTRAGFVDVSAPGHPSTR